MIMKTGNNVVNSAQFVQVVSDKNLREYGIYNGDVMMVMGFKEGQETPSDPYLFRKYAVVSKFDIEEGLLYLPSEDTDHMSYVIDPRNLEYVGHERQTEYEKLIELQYARPEGTA